MTQGFTILPGKIRFRGGHPLVSILLSLGAFFALAPQTLHAQELQPVPANEPLKLLPVPLGDKQSLPDFPINLPTAMQLANARPLDIQIASERIQAAQAQLLRARALWLPTLAIGGDYYRHDGQIQDIRGKVFGTGKSSLLVGLGPSAVFALTDAIYSPLAARQVLRSREADRQAAINDTLLQTAEAYFNVQESRGDVASAMDTVKRSEDLFQKTSLLTPGLAPPAEATRVRAELARRRQDLEYAHEHWQVQSAELLRVLHMQAGLQVSPVEPPHLKIDLVNPEKTVEDLIPIALTLRPELASQQALVQASLARLKQEKMRPLIPSVLLRGNGTQPGGALSSGWFGGGINSFMGDFGMRNSMDLQVLWELESFGIGNIALKRERQAENQVATLEFFKTRDRVAAEVAQAAAQAQRSAKRLIEAEEGLRFALDTADKNYQGLSQTRRAGELLVLVYRPQEVLISIQALQQAYRDFYKAVAENNKAQFRLYRALGHPGQEVAGHSILLKGEIQDTSKQAPQDLLPAVHLERPQPLLP
ncbi:MAG: TolC family protein [Gemmataceae bacterium]|nr:TolC family protein [Gemmataceae bacterium]